jgi:hypothetical protein
MTSLMIRPEQRLLVKNLMKDLDAGHRRLQDHVRQGRWDAVERVAEEMAQSARRLAAVQPKKEAEDFHIRSVEMEHDLSLMAREARRQDEASVRTGLRDLQFTCDSCHRKFQKGRPW